MIAIYTEQISSRLSFTLTELFATMHGLEIGITTNYEEFRQMPEGTPKICYSQDYIGQGLHIRPQGLLFEKSIHPQNINDVTKENGQVYFFKTGEDNETAFAYDIFSASFYLLSRYEEYLPSEKDQHGRFKATDSLAYQHGFLEEPVIDQWVLALLSRLYALFPQMERSKRTFRHLKTIDVDNVFAYRHKGAIINGLHLIKDAAKGNWTLFKQRLKVILRLEEDPFFNLAELSQTLQPYSSECIFFFHCGCYGKHDKKVWLPSLKYAKIRKYLAKKFKVGLHPSYRAAHKAWIFNLEKRILRKRIGQEVTSCRAHYLLFTIPTDYRMLAENGIKDDYTMGYSNNPGFRAGTSLPFHFYDLEMEAASALLIHPLAVMDKTLHSNLKMEPEEALAYILRLAEKVKAVEGEFVSLFHNENQTEAEGFGWKGWKDIYIKLIDSI